MKGTEKQIAFANKLIDTMNAKFDELIIFFSDKDEKQMIAFRDGEEKYNEIFDNSYAGDVIELLKYNKYDSCLDYYRDLCAALRIGVTTEPLCRKIMKEVYGKE